MPIPEVRTASRTKNSTDFMAAARANHLFVLSLIIRYICGKFWFNNCEKKGFNKQV